MKRIILVYGIISGLVVATLMVISTYHCSSTQDYEGGMIWGYASMLLAFSMVFVGIKTYRDKYNGGVIKFGKAFKVGALIVLISSTFYVVTWLIENYFFLPDFATMYTNSMIAKIQASGESQAVIAEKVADLRKWGELYKNPFINAMMTYMEILPVGLIVTLISALILKRKTQKQF